MKYFVLRYKTIATYPEDRQAFRKEHLELAQRHYRDGSLVLGGAMENPVDEALLVFKGENDDVAKSFAVNDPYVRKGLVKSWDVREWNVVIGDSV